MPLTDHAWVETIDASLAELEAMRARGRRLLSKAQFADSDAAGIHYNVNTVMRRRFNTNRERYLNAHRNAVRMAHLAKRAIEQRLGMRLSEMRADLTLVEAPSTWEATVCTLEGIDYSRIRESTSLPSDNYAGEFIGDYVTKLERLVESYRLDFPFQNSSDTTVISLRDEVHNSRAVCDADVANLVYHSGRLDTATAEAPGWDRVGCAVDAGTGEDLPDCVVARPLTAAEETAGGNPVTPFSTAHPDLSAAIGYRLTFGDADLGGSGGMTASTALVQRFELPAGRYRISWYAAPISMVSGPAPDAVLDVRDANSGSSFLPGTMPASESASSPWNRYWQIFDVPESSDVEIAFVPDSILSGSQEVDVAAVMLEDVTDSLAHVSYILADEPPRPFANTGDTRTTALAACEDTTGRVFRNTAWRRGCVRLCGEGYGRGCEGSAGVENCYWETEFSLTTRDIERGRLVHSGGFARGNYNYRTESVSLNFVGTGVRDCSDADLPSTCYAGGFVPYSLYHIGPYRVRNHMGHDFEAALFEGRIEHARGLAAERYVTNPLSTADRALVEPYLHRELNGRPLDGHYVLRVWEEPGVNFDAIEDVQVVLNYRYWTRLD